MSLHNPMCVGSEPNEAPAATWEVYIELEFDPRMTPEQIKDLDEKLFDGLQDLVRDTVGVYVVGRPDAWVYDIRGCGRETPVFPMVAGAARFTCDMDVEEAIEGAGRGTPLAEIAYDACGRAYELGAQPEYIRRPELDGERRADMPDPEKYDALNRGQDEEFATLRRTRAVKVGS